METQSKGKRGKNAHLTWKKPICILRPREGIAAVAEDVEASANLILEDLVFCGKVHSEPCKESSHTSGMAVPSGRAPGDYGD